MDQYVWIMREKVSHLKYSDQPNNQYGNKPLRYTSTLRNYFPWILIRKDLRMVLPADWGYKLRRSADWKIDLGASNGGNKNKCTRKSRKRGESWLRSSWIPVSSLMASVDLSGNELSDGGSDFHHQCSWACPWQLNHPTGCQKSGQKQ